MWEKEGESVLLLRNISLSRITWGPIFFLIFAVELLHHVTFLSYPYGWRFLVGTSFEGGKQGRWWFRKLALGQSQKFYLSGNCWVFFFSLDPPNTRESSCSHSPLQCTRSQRKTQLSQTGLNAEGSNEMGSLMQI